MFGNDDNGNGQMHDGGGDQPVDDNSQLMPVDNGGDYQGDQGAPAPSDDQPHDQPAEDQGPAPDQPSDDVLPNDHADKDDLLNLKQEALQQLSPLLGHLDQTPEEKFRTTMMMIQASDNAGMLKEAYEAAQAIPDEKVKAQALLDVINEINYFSQQHEQ
jgi:hypothetical protein